MLHSDEVVGLLACLLKVGRPSQHSAIIEYRWLLEGLLGQRSYGF